ncbi:MAG: MFS transporter [Candidatus Nanohaloarchaea archaeon]|nr:MFS transporter [Candidatus Nanohaloarchaea archaeon]
MDRNVKTILFHSIIAGLFAFAVRSVLAVLSPYLESLGISETIISLVFGMFPLGMVLLSPVIGHISDRIGRNKIILAGLALQSAALLLYILDIHTAFLFISRLLESGAAVSVGLITIAKIEDHMDQDTRGKYTGIGMSIKSVGKSGGSLAGGYIADYFGLITPFYVGLSLTTGLLIVFSFVPRREDYSVSRGDFNLFRELGEFLSFVKLQGMAVLGFFMHAKNITIATFLPLFISKELGFSYSVVGNTLFLLGVLHLLQFAWGSLIDGKKKSNFVVGGVLTTAVALLIFSQAQTSYILYLAALVHSLGASLWNTSAWAFMSDIGEENDIEGEVVGSYMSLSKIGALPASIVNGFIVTYLGYSSLFGLYAGLVTLAGVVALAMFARSRA